ncbi:MAG: hypothetical protein IPK97_18455 [Ahniella sp.]|nr:hypothetical protein [Ahniella sp.]
MNMLNKTPKDFEPRQGDELRQTSGTRPRPSRFESTKAQMVGPRSATAGAQGECEHLVAALIYIEQDSGASMEVVDSLEDIFESR